MSIGGLNDKIRRNNLNENNLKIKDLNEKKKKKIGNKIESKSNL
jgi:hypothetical protein